MLVRVLRHVFASLFVVTLTASAAVEAPRERLPFNAAWRFQKGDPVGTTTPLDYVSVKEWIAPTGADLVNFHAVQPVRPSGNLGGDIAFAQPGFDDSAWRKLELPHDWGIEGPFAQENPGETGKLPWWGVAWYRKSFDLPASDAGRRIYLDVDGAMSYALVWCNGQFVGGWPYGYSSWRMDLTPYVRPGTANVISIRLDNPTDSSRWYPGGGIYRNVWLVKTGPVHIAQWGVSVTTPLITSESATVDAQVLVDNKTAATIEVKVSAVIHELGSDGRPLGEPVARSETIPVTTATGTQALSALSLRVLNPKLWDIKHPHRYVLVTTVQQGSQIVDRVETRFGIRSIAFTADRGFFLNGRQVTIQGVCQHHDLGALGAALNVRALERQIEILQAMGCNAIRTSHNPPAPELLDLCDRMGVLVIDEAFDCWRHGKKKSDYSVPFVDWHEKDLRALIRRDRNHPCVILWSIGNEIMEQRDPLGWKLATHLAGIVRQEDRTRGVTAGFNNVNAGYNGFQTALDVVGYNYKPQEYPRFRQRNPAIPLIGSETSSCVSSRGEYFFPVSEDKAEGRSNFQMSSYDLYAPRWATPPDAEFKGQDQAPYVASEFVWTGFDYLGEPTPYNRDSTNLLNFSDPADQARADKELKELGKINVPSRSSYFGIIDLAGFPKDRYYIYQARWRPDLPMAHILPHWNWPERVGQITPVHVYTSGDEAELFLNGRSLGRKRKEPLMYRLRWDDVSYAPGELRVVAYKEGRKWTESVMKTTGAATKLTLQADRATIRADGDDLSFITVTVADRDGLLVPRSHPLVKFEIEGPGEIVAVDNGDATSFEPFQASQRAAYNGLALVIVRAKAGPGQIVLKARSEGLAAAELVLTTTAP
jgi:beta-galactosidase